MPDTNEATNHTPIPEPQRRALATVGRAILDGRPITDEMIRNLPARYLAIGSFGPARVPLTPAGRAYALAAAADWAYHYTEDSRAFAEGRRETIQAKEAVARADLRLENVLRDLGVLR